MLQNFRKCGNIFLKKIHYIRRSTHWRAGAWSRRAGDQRAQVEGARASRATMGGGVAATACGPTAAGVRGGDQGARGCADTGRRRDMRWNKVGLGFV